MISIKEAIQLMQDSINGMQRSGMIEEAVTVDTDTVILGSGSFLDSLGFVTFISDLEERLCVELDKEIYLVLNEIGEFNINNPFLSAGTIASYIEKITQE